MWEYSCTKLSQSRHNINYYYSHKQFFVHNFIDIIQYWYRLIHITGYPNIVGGCKKQNTAKNLIAILTIKIACIPINLLQPPAQLTYYYAWAMLIDNWISFHIFIIIIIMQNMKAWWHISYHIISCRKHYIRYRDL